MARNLFWREKHTKRIESDPNLETHSKRNAGAKERSGVGGRGAVVLRVWDLLGRVVSRVDFCWEFAEIDRRGRMDVETAPMAVDAPVASAADAGM